jgi:hypothetical protein
VKFFQKTECGSQKIEDWINQFLQENADSIKVIDIKHAAVAQTYASFCTCTVMIIYETL